MTKSERVYVLSVNIISKMLRCCAYVPLMMILTMPIGGCVTNRTPSIPSQTVAVPNANIWKILQQRPLHLPIIAPKSPCPTTHGYRATQAYGLALGSGPVYPIGFSIDGVLQYADAQTFGSGKSNWGGQSVLWIINPNYHGSALVRGKQIDGPGDLRFNGGFDQMQFVGDWTIAPLLTELRLIGDNDYGTPWPSWPSYTRLRTPGCYAYQVDGLNFSEIIVFKATPVHLNFPTPTPYAGD